MKKTYLIGLIFILFTLTVIGCSRDTINDEKKLISEFTKNYFTNSNNDPKILKKYMTDDAYTMFYNDGCMPSRTSYSESYTGDINDLEIGDINIDSIDDTNDDYHYYDVSFKLSNIINKNEADVKFKVSLEKQGTKWRLGSNNRFGDLYIWMRKMWEQ